MVSGFDTNTLPANDDGSTGLVNLPFNIDFFGNTYSALYVNNNGNLTFNAPLSTYTPSGLTTYGSPIIAPFWADVDTLPGGNPVTYGTGTVDGHAAFGVDWPGVDCFATTGGGQNFFQVVLVDRSDIAPGDFDIEYNYNQIQWDSGQASGGNAACQGGTAAQVGYTNGSTNALELAGSGVDGAFLDGGPDALISGSQNSTTPGRYIFPIRSGGGGGSIGGHVTDQGGNAVPGALVSACGTGSTVTQCFLGNTDSNGNYLVLGVPPAVGSSSPQAGYEVTASPPSGSALNQQTQPQAPNPPLSVTIGQTTTQNFVLTGPTPPPNHTIVSGNGTTVVGGQQIPVIYWETTTPISTEACDGGTVSIKITADNSQTGLPATVGPYNLTETGLDPSTGLGIFTGSIPPLYPLHGPAAVEIDITCAGVPQTPVVFSVYIDPSGTVVDQNNNPIVGATVTLLNSDSLGGTYTAVPNNSAIMSPANRNNPDTTGAGGQFGWDTVPGFYEVQATAPGCNTVTTPAFQVPPPALGLQIQLTCLVPPTAVTSAATGLTGTAATLNGSVNPNGTETHYYFEYGSDTTYGTTTASADAGSGTTAVPESFPLAGLTPGATYHFQLVATYGTNTVLGGDQSFTEPDNDLGLTNVPGNITTTATSSAGAVVNYTSPTPVDGASPSSATVNCVPPSGSIFPIGTTTVTCTATDPDDSNSPVQATFTVTVNPVAGATAPVKDALVDAYSKSGPVSATIAAPGSDLLVAFVAACGPSNAAQTTTVSGGGLTWTPVGRTNTEDGTSEVWTARAPDGPTNVTVTAKLAHTGFPVYLTVVAFSHATGTGVSTGNAAGTGAPLGSLTTSSSPSWVWAVGNDPGTATGRKVGAGQTLQSQKLTATSDTFWVQSLNNEAAPVGTHVTINDKTPAYDPWNLTLIEIL